MEKQQFIDELNELLAEEFEVEVSTIQPEGSVKMTLALDSLSLIDLVAVIENTYKVKISGQEMMQIKKFSELYDFLYERIEK
ncbi:MAG: acyl carrier protein [Paludibacteraceae bacterium]|nr:acyl carrier protein [Paludibacteraceae bacterium]MBO7635527.1 acyl carrier protein [Paludibacteraceae bacterium]MBR0502032.1 acyl carrier protein [Paludibacteraceae bacterium]MBR5973266.1 acyl carrier protein [Paludibacteraceae bacterium]